MRESIAHIIKRKLRTPKVFCIGTNKTGTTSFATAMKDLGYRMPLQRDFELLFDDWVKRDFNRITQLVSNYEAFQDVPFSLPFTYVVMDQVFPGSKFVLTIRANDEDWYQSITRFHSKKWGKDGRIPTREDLMEAKYLYKGRPDYTNRHIYNTPFESPYDKETLVNYYHSYNSQVKNYFKYRPDDLLIIDVAQEDAYIKLCEFIGCAPIYATFPWKNRTR